MTRPLPRTAAVLTTLVVVVASLLTVAAAVPAQASLGSALRLPTASASGDAEGDVVGDATMYMRRLALGRDEMSGAARKRADAALARPKLTGERITCSNSAPICVHYASGGADRPGGQISPGLVLQTLDHIYGVYQSSGYRMPEADHTTGGGSVQVNGRPVPADDIDIYLANIGEQGYYGYCAPEPRRGSSAHHTPAFCVLDNDYANEEFPHGTPLTNLQVTAAHEFFHAVQFAYDATEDSWFMESTAVWMEDEVYDNINDNTQYLPYGPLGKPGLSLDKKTAFGVYGGWIFFRWITEHRPQLVGQLPGIILSMWQRAAAGGHDRYSLQAINGALKAAKMPLRTTFARFAAANRDAAQAYAEGAADHYPVAAPTGSYRLSALRQRSGTATIDHLAAATERFTPHGPRLAAKRTKLRLRLDMADTDRGSAAMVTVFRRDGSTRLHPVRLNRHGGGFVAVSFSSRTIARVELTMTNASTRMRCWVGGRFSCQGQPKDMHQLERFHAAVRRA